MATEYYTKWPQNIPKATKNTYIFLCKSLQNLPKLGFFVLQIYDLATLLLLQAFQTKQIYLYAEKLYAIGYSLNGQVILSPSS
jgi:hypothetical protein